MYITIGFLCLVAVLGAAVDSSTQVENAAPSSMLSTEKPLCEERVCPRIYSPVCSLVDDKLVTSPTRCDLSNKMRCAAVYRQVLDKRVPNIRYLHDGPCDPTHDSSYVVRMRSNLSKDGEIDADCTDGDNNEVSASKRDELASSEEDIDSSEEGSIEDGASSSEEDGAEDNKDYSSADGYEYDDYDDEEDYYDQYGSDSSEEKR